MLRRFALAMAWLMIIGGMATCVLREAHAEEPSNEGYVLTVITWYERVPRKTQELVTFEKEADCEREAEKVRLMLASEDVKFAHIVLCVLR